jgi:hypothetical protein
MRNLEKYSDRAAFMKTFYEWFCAEGKFRADERESVERALAYQAIFYRKHVGGMAVMLEEYFPRSVASYELILLLDEFELHIAELAGYEFDAALESATKINDLMGLIYKKRSIVWTPKDWVVAAWVTEMLVERMTVELILDESFDLNSFIRLLRTEANAAWLERHGDAHDA